MCGIAGFIDFNNHSDLDIITKMSGTMSHRGPDGQQEYFLQIGTCQIGLGHRRLSIIDLSHAADQPMHFQNLTIVFNGEIYNYQEIKEELIRAGHKFQTTSDTEVILHSWKEWGAGAIKKWHGMFAIVMYDSQQQQLICIRDRAGVKPLYYHWHNNIFLFGSELKAIMAHPSFEKKINKDSVASYLQYGYVSGPFAIFEHTYKLQPGHLMYLDLVKKEISIEQYWNVYDYYNKPKLNILLPEAIRETEDILEKAFQYRMVADVPVGVFLSGGFDSTCVAALLQKNSTSKIKTFTIGSTDNKLDEAPFARQIANRLGTDHTEYYCTSKEALDIIPGLPYFYDEPFADSSAIPTMLVSRMAKKDVSVALSADAGDEIFAGYNRYDYISRYGDKLKAIPGPFRKIAVGIMNRISSKNIPVFNNKPNFHSRYDKLKNLLNDPSPATLLKNLSVVFTDTEIVKLFSTISTISTLHTSKELKHEYYDALSFMMAVDYKTYMVDDILQKVDRATMSTSLEGREPFLDQDIIQWAAQLPSDYKYHNGIKKYILKEIVYKYVPKQVMDRPKMGFSIPVSEWLSKELRPLVEGFLTDQALDQHGLFNKVEIMQLKKDFFSGRKEKYLKIWYLLMFQMWYKHWMA